MLAAFALIVAAVMAAHILDIIASRRKRPP
jgi:hypothetical protein